MHTLNRHVTLGAIKVIGATKARVSVQKARVQSANSATIQEKVVNFIPVASTAI